MKDKTKFKELMTGLCELFDKKYSKVLADIYWTALKPFSDKECEKAFNQVITTCKFFPKPAELLEILRGTEKDQALKAWLKVEYAIKRIGTYESIRFDDLAIHTVIEVMGGWPKLCSTPEDELHWKQKDFERLYPIVKDQAEHPSHVIGLIEQENSATGHIDHIPAPVLIGRLPNGKIKVLRLAKAKAQELLQEEA